MSVALPKVDLRPDHWAIVRDALRRHVPDRKVLAFGSRATWTAKDYSDLDLAIMGGEPLSLRAVSALDEALVESDLPFRVDIVDWARIDDAFRSVIRRHGVSVQHPTGSIRRPAPTRGSTRPRRNSGAVSKWASINLRRACTKIGSGATPRGGKDVYLPRGPYALIRSQNVFNEGFRHDGLAYIGDGHAFDLAGVEVRDGDVLLNITGDSVARACQVDTRILPARVNQHVAIVRPDPRKLDPGFLRYYLVCPDTQARLLSWAGSGGTRHALTKAMIETFDVQAPEDVSEQRAIAQVLGTLDDKIELNRRMNETLEALSRTLFRSWFVDFGPVRAKMEGRDTGLPQDIADLFPDRMMDSEMGEIPEGWEVSQIGDEVDAVGGSTPSTKEPSYWHQGDHYWATPKDLSKLLSPVLLDTTRKITDAGLRKISSRTLPVGTVLLSSRAPIGYLAIAEIPTAVNQGFIAMKCQRRLPNLYVLYWCEQNLGYIRDIAGGSTFAEISKKTFRTVSMVVPTEAILAMYQRLSRPIYDLLVTKVKEAATLAALRDALLPKLISGEIRVPATDQERVP